MNKDCPSVSVVMCTYNGAAFIPAQLDSILSQNYPIREIIIQDDQSTDDTLRILQAYAIRDSRIRIFTVDKRRGINHNFITAIDKAQGDLVAWSDQDDVWLPDKLDKLVADIRKEDSWISFHLTQGFIGNCPAEAGPFDRRTPNFGLERELFLGTVPGHTMLFRRELHRMIRERVPDRTLEQLSEAFYYDAILSIVANAYGKVHVIVEPLDFHRRLPTSASGGFVKRDRMKRSASNAILQILRCMNPLRRRKIRPYFVRRMTYLSRLIDCFPDATHTGNVRHMIQSYQSPWKIIQFPCALVQNRDRILYAKEDHELTAVLRAALFAITYQDYFAINLK